MKEEELPPPPEDFEEFEEEEMPKLPASRKMEFERPVMPRVTPARELMAPPEIKAVRPFIYVKISKYKDVVGAVNDLRENLFDLEKVIAELKKTEDEEAKKVEEIKSNINEANRIIDFFERTFTTPTD